MPRCMPDATGEGPINQVIRRIHRRYRNQGNVASFVPRRRRSHFCRWRCFAGLAGCSPSGETKGAEATSAAAAGETRDLGSASFEPTADTKKADETKEVDIVVVGSGMGGISAALTAIEEGAKSVVLLEKNHSLGGSTNMAECPAGARPFEYTEEEARAASAGAQADSYGVSDPMLLYSMFRDAKENFAWLSDTHGVIGQARTRLLLSTRAARQNRHREARCCR